MEDNKTHWMFYDVWFTQQHESAQESLFECSSVRRPGVSSSRPTKIGVLYRKILLMPMAITRLQRIYGPQLKGAVPSQKTSLKCITLSPK